MATSRNKSNTPTFRIKSSRYGLRKTTPRVDFPLMPITRIARNNHTVPNKPKGVTTPPPEVRENFVTVLSNNSRILLPSIICICIIGLMICIWLYVKTPSPAPAFSGCVPVEFPTPTTKPTPTPIPHSIADVFKAFNIAL